MNTPAAKGAGEESRQETATLLLEVLPSVMAHVASQLRRSAPIDNPVHFRLMRTLRRGAHSLHDLADLHEVRLPTMSRTVSVLEGRGWLRRTRSREDRRTVYAEATPEGLQVLSQVETQAIRRATTLLQCMDSEDLAALRRGLSALETVVRDDFDMDPDTGRVRADSAGCS